MSDPLKMELQVLVSHPVGAGNSESSAKAISGSYPLGHLSSPKDKVLLRSKKWLLLDMNLSLSPISSAKPMHTEQPLFGRTAHHHLLWLTPWVPNPELRLH